MGGNCSDPVVSSLKDVNYNAVRLPRADIRPLEILVRNGSTLSRVGGLTSLFIPGDEGVPVVTNDTPVSSFSGQRTHEMNVGLGLSILGPVIKAMGGNLGIDAAYKTAKSVTFEFADVLSDTVTLIDLDAFLGAADVNHHAKSVGQMLDADTLYVITDVIKSAKLSVEAKKSNGSDLKVDVPVIQQIVGGNVKVSAESASSTKVIYEGKIPLVFGIKAVHLFYDKGQYQTFKPAPVEDGAVGMAATGGMVKHHQGRSYLAAAGAFVSLQGS